ncbi:GNAT family N-acetyltransferase [Ammonicoccus fulvus]|uniref:GNAT family N-acetyltransferase n=1 Tax=Ammonicoccus fulvus TaxID=3138240 RepID=A0ABZ3FNV2_9ACTN
MTISADDLTIRSADASDQEAVEALLRNALGKDDDPNYPAFLEWKHRQNAFGVSPAWVAVHEARIVGYRTFMRWAFRTGEGKRVTAVRAVDTATDPDYQGLGIFRRLTLQGVADLTLAGDGIVFNTPNDKSRPGYLKMGWQVSRRVPIGVLPRTPQSLIRMATSRVAASIWSEETQVGLPAANALTDLATASALLAHAPSRAFRTDRTPEYLAWRTAFEPLNYRLLLADESDPRMGGLIFRLRRRGAALEAAVIEQLVPDVRTGVRLMARMLNLTKADYAIAVRTSPSTGLIPLPGNGPLLTTRPLAASPPPAKEWALTLGDLELF